MASETVVRRLVIPTCVGCGSMAIPGTCEQGCREERRDVVDAGSFERAVVDEVRSRAAAAAFREVALGLASEERRDEADEDAYRRLQTAALTVLRSHPQPAEPDTDEPRRETTWWCPECGGFDAPQPCLGICVWKPAEWVDADVWQRQCERRDEALSTEGRLRRLLRGAAFVTPREGAWKAGRRVLRSAAQQALSDEPVQPERKRRTKYPRV